MCTAVTRCALAVKLKGGNAKVFLDEVGRYNEAVRTDVHVDGSGNDGRGTEGLELPKSNWANTIDAPPFEAYHVGCGITFTFGGLRIDPKSAPVINDDLEPISGLSAAGELVGGLFNFNYPSGTGLTPGAVSIGRAPCRERASP